MKCFFEKKMVCILISFAQFFWHWFAFKLLVSTNFRTVPLDLHTHIPNLVWPLFISIAVWLCVCLYFIRVPFTLLCFDNTLFFGIKKVRFWILLKTLSSLKLRKREFDWSTFFCWTNKRLIFSVKKKRENKYSYFKIRNFVKLNSKSPEEILRTKVN